MSHKEKIPSEVIVWFQNNGWMDTNLMIRYIDYLNDLRVKNKVWGDSSMLVYDSFRGHLEKSIKEKFYESGIHLVIIPGGLSNMYSPLDISINKPFKDNLRKE